MSTKERAVVWAPRVKQVKIRRLYRSARLGIYDDEALEAFSNMLVVSMHGVLHLTCSSKDDD